MSLQVRQKKYRVRLYDEDDSTVIATYTGEVASPPTYGAQIIRPLRARAETNPFDIEIVDVNESVTADLFDADGAFRLRGRMTDVSESLTEVDGENLLKWSSDFTQSQAWGVSAELTQSQVPSIISGQEATKYTGDGATPSRSIRQAYGTLSSGFETAYVVVENVDGQRLPLGIRDTDLDQWVVFARLDWSDGSVAVERTDQGSSASAGSLDLGIGPNGGQAYLLWVQAIPDNPGNLKRVWCYPTDSLATSDTAIVHHAQATQSSDVNTAYIVTDSDPVTSDEGAWNVTFTGRILDVEQSQHVLSYNFRITDERWIEREHDIFINANTTSLVPPGIREDITTFPNAQSALVGSVSATVDKTFTNSTRLRFDEPQYISTNIIEYIKDDSFPERSPESADKGNSEGMFEHIRVSVDGTDHEILSFDKDWRIVNTIINDAEESITSTDAPLVRYVWVSDAGASLGPDGTSYDIFVYAPTAPPSDTVPLHIGEADPDGILRQKGGVHPFQLVKEIYDGDYSEDGVSVRYDSTAIQSLIDDDSYPNVNFRITDVHKMSEWLDDNIYQIFRVVPFINQTGEISLRSIALPTSDDITLSELSPLDHTNVSSVPTAVFAGSDAVTKITFDWPVPKPVPFPKLWQEYPADRMPEERSKPLVLEHDPVSGKGGGRELTFKLDGLVIERLPALETIISTHPRFRAQAIASDIFALFGDGPQIGSFKGLEASVNDGTKPGSVAKIDIDTHPNGITASRGGARIVQILTRTREPGGVRYDYIDLGPDLQPLAPPTVSVSKSGADGFNTVDITLSGIPTDATVQVQGSYDQSNWADIAGDTTETSITYGKVKSGTTFYVRARSKKTGRITSEWAVDSAVMDTLAAPSNVAADDDGNTVALTWENPTHDDRKVMPVWNEPGSLEDYLSEPLPANTKKFLFNHLDAGGHDIGVKYVDKFGGESPAATVTVNITTTDQLPEPEKLQLIQADQNGIRLPTPDEEYVVGTGLEISFEPQARYANVEAQVADDSGFSTIVASEIIPPGVYRHKFLGLPIKDDPTNNDLEDYHVRIRHVKEGYPSSGWSSVVSGEATRMLENAGPDLFAGGFAFLDVETGGALKLIAGSDDVDTDRIIYRINKNPSGGTTFTDPDNLGLESDQTIPSTSFPYEDDANDTNGDPISLVSGDVVYLTAIYWNDTAGAYGQVTYDVYRVSESEDFVRAFPILDVDGKDAVLFPRRSEPADSIRYVVDETDAPTLAEVQAGTVSTANEITVHTFSAHGDEIWVGILAYSGSDGTGTEVGEGGGTDPFVLKAEYTSQDDRPTLFYHPVAPKTNGAERFRLAAFDDSGQVGIKHRTFDEGAHPGDGVWDADTGLVADPAQIDIDVTRPSEGSAFRVLEAVAYDSDGNQSHPNDRPLRIIVDPDIFPVLSDVSVNVKHDTGEVFVTVDRQDGDVGSWRIKWITADPGTDAYQDVDFTGNFEASGNTFGSSQKIASLTLEEGEAVFVSALGFRTTSTDNTSQNASLASPQHVRDAATRTAKAPPVLITWRKGAMPDGSTAEGKEVIEFTATPFTDTGVDGVAFWYAVQDEGDPEPTWSASTHRHTDDDGVVDSSGYADEVRKRVEVTRPSSSTKEGGTRKAVWFRGERNAPGSAKFTEPQILYVDADLKPQGTFIPNQPRTGKDNVFITPTSSDPDTGSWRFRVNHVTIGGANEDTYLSPAFDDLAADEFSGNVFGAAVDTEVVLAEGEKLNVVGLFFGTTDSTDTTQSNASLRTAEIKFEVLGRGEDYYDIQLPSGIQIAGAFIVDIEARALINGDASSATLSYRESNQSGGMGAWQDAPLNPDTITFNRGTRSNFGGAPTEEKVVEFAVKDGGDRHGERQIVVPAGKIEGKYSTRSLTSTDATIEGAEVLAGGVSLDDGTLAWSDDGGQNWTTMATNPDNITVPRPTSGSDPTEVVLGYDDGVVVTKLNTFIDIPAQT